MDVVHVQTQRLHALMGEAETLDDLIGLQDEQWVPSSSSLAQSRLAADPLHLVSSVSAVQDLCLLSSQTTPLHRTVLAILDLALLLADLLASFLPSVLGDSARSAAAPPSTRPPLPKRTKSKRSYRSRMKYGVGSDEEDISDLEPVGGDDGDVGEGGEGDSTWAAGEGSRSAWAGQTTTIDFVSEDLAARLQRCARLPPLAPAASAMLTRHALPVPLCQPDGRPAQARPRPPARDRHARQGGRDDAGDGRAARDEGDAELCARGVEGVRERRGGGSVCA